MHCCVQALESVARQTGLLDSESVKTYLATMEVSEAHEAKLVEDLARFYHVPEGNFIDYKEMLPGYSDSERRELLADVSSFANAAGLIRTLIVTRLFSHSPDSSWRGSHSQLMSSSHVL